MTTAPPRETDPLHQHSGPSTIWTTVNTAGDLLHVDGLGLTAVGAWRTWVIRRRVS